LELNFDVHGLGVKVVTNDISFANYVADNLSIFESGDQPSPDLEVNYSFCRGSGYGIKPGLEMERIGRQIWSGESSVLFRSRGLEVLARLEPYGLSIDSRYHQRDTGRSQTRRLIRKIRGGNLPESRKIEISHYAARSSVHLPIFWLFGKRRNLTLIHASSVSIDGGTLVFTGLNNCGKSTLAASLSINRGWPQMSDNFTLVDGSRVYAYPESRRISMDMLKAVPGADEGKEAYGKLHMPEGRKEVPMTSGAKNVYFMSLGSGSSIVPVDRQMALWKIMAINDFIGEFPEYSYLRFLTDSGREEESRYRVIEKFLSNSKQYLLTQSSEPNLDETYRLIEGTLL